MHFMVDRGTSNEQNGFLYEIEPNPCTLLDFDQIRQNAQEQGVSLSEIAICYEYLDESEMGILEGLGLVAHRQGAAAIGRFTESGEALLPQKAVSVLMIGAT
jgi:hypothetical protein